MNIKAIILAAGQGTRMKSEVPKVMHAVCNFPMIDYVISSAERLFKTTPTVVVGHKSEAVMSYVGNRCRFVMQEKQLGTGHAVMAAKEYICESDIVLIICGDTPLIKDETLLLMKEKIMNNDAVIMTSIVDNPTGYGRVIVDGKTIKIIEEKDASDEVKAINLINAGTYMIKGNVLLQALDLIDNNNSQNEYYLTDIFNFINDAAIVTADKEEILGINSRLQLADANLIMKKRINEFHMLNGVTLIDPNLTYIDKDVKIGRDTIIYPNVHLRGDTEVGSFCEIYENTTIKDSKIRDNVVINSSKIVESEVGAGSNIGPFAYLRPKSVLGKNVKIGDFVEVKSAKIGNNTKASHLAYIGDADVGENVNIGCGVVFVNYDGKNKFKSTVYNNAFIGSNCNIIAPVTIDENAYIATGTTVTADVPKDSLCIGRSRATIKANWKRK